MSVAAMIFARGPPALSSSSPRGLLALLMAGWGPPQPPLGSVSMAPVTSLETLLGAVDGVGVARRGSFEIHPGCQGNTPLLWQVEGQEGGKLGGYSRAQ